MLPLNVVYKLIMNEFNEKDSMNVAAENNCDAVCDLFTQRSLRKC